MRISQQSASKILLGVLAALVVFSVGFIAGQYTRVNLENGKPKVTVTRELPTDKKDLNFSLFWEVWDRLQRDYFAKDKIDEEALIYGAIRGMVGAVGDPYTEFLPPAKQKTLVEDLSGSFEGVGIHIGFKGSQLAVVTPVAGSPAERAGVKAGDFIVYIKDNDRKIDRGTVGITLEEAVQAIRGPAGTKVTLTLTREGTEKPFNTDIVRDKIQVPSVELKFVDKDGKRVPHLKLFSFGEETNREWDKAIKQIIDTCGGIPGKNSKCEGIVFDMRNNSGGFLNGSVYIGSEFLKSGTIVIQEHSSGAKDTLAVNRTGKLIDVPIVVLVNKGSASASEIVAGALQDHKRAKIVGDTTFGKGSIQESRELSGGAGLKVTTARWLTPNGTWVNEKGLEPDVKVEDKADTEEDEQLDRAIEELLNL